MKKTIAVIGTLDTKGEECKFLKDTIECRGFGTLVIDAGVLGEPGFPPDILKTEVAQAGGENVGELAAGGDRGAAVRVMAKGVKKLLPELYRSGRFHGVIALGGGGGTSIATAGMRELPFGVPKVMVSTLAGRNVAEYVGIKDIVMISSIVDLAGLNRISRDVLLKAAYAICGMSEVEGDKRSERIVADTNTVAATMFGNTTPCVDAAREMLKSHGYEVLVFSCTGTSGMIMEHLIQSRHISAVFDVTITELADELAGGVLSAGEHRLEAAGAAGIPQVVGPGCLDMVNFGGPSSVPAKYKDRIFYRHNPNVTLMRTTVEENARLGDIIASKLNRSRGPVKVFLPMKGLSMIDSPGGPFWLPGADCALFESLKGGLRDGIECVELDCNINDPEFALTCVQALIGMMDPP